MLKSTTTCKFPLNTNNCYDDNTILFVLHFSTLFRVCIINFIEFVQRELGSKHKVLITIAR